MQLIQARVIGVPRQVTTKYGEKIVFDALVNGKDEIAIWRPAKDAHLLSTIKMNEKVTLGKDSKGKYHLVDEDNSEAIVKAETVSVTDTKPAKTHESTISDDTKREIGRYVKDMADLYGFCLKTASSIEGINDNDRRQIATTLFISTKERFSL